MMAMAMKLFGRPITATKSVINGSVGPELRLPLYLESGLKPDIAPGNIRTEAPPWQIIQGRRGRSAAGKTCYPGNIGITFLRRGPKFGQPQTRCRWKQCSRLRSGLRSLA